MAVQKTFALIEMQVEAKGYVMASILDIESAFNNTSREVIKEDSPKHEIPLPNMN